MKIAIPSSSPGGLGADISPHFGHCEVFTLVEVEGEEVRQVDVLTNAPHEQGGCMAPILLLKQAGAEALVAGGMGMRPLMGFQQAGIDVFFAETAIKVEAAVKLVTSGQARRFGPAQACGGGSGNCSPH